MSMNEQIANLSFLSLFGSMVCYWVGPLSRDLIAYPQIVSQTENNVSIDKIYDNSLVLTNKQNTSTIQPVIQTPVPSNFSNIFSFGSVINNLRKKIDVSESLFFTGRLGIVLSNVLLMILLCNRWIESGHFPLSNLYESLMFLSWSFTIIHLLLENLTSSDVQSISKAQNVSQGLPVRKFIGAITTPSALFTNAFATFTLPKEMQASSSLVPALQSNWLMMHVTVMIISYATLILGSLLAIAYLIIDIQTPQTQTNFHNPQLGVDNVEDRPRPEKSRGSASLENTRSSIVFTLDNLSYV